MIFRKAKAKMINSMQNGTKTRQKNKIKGLKKLKEVWSLCDTIEHQLEIGHSLNIAIDVKKSNFGSQKWLQFYIWLFMTKERKTEFSKKISSIKTLKNA